MVADRIRELVGSFPVTDAVTGEVRPAKYSDIVLLFRATTGWDEDFRRILSECGIPVHVTSRTGYFETLEIQGIVNFLRVLDNPLQDIPLFGVLKLPYFNFSEEEITWIRYSVGDLLDRQAQAENKPVKKLFLYEQIKLYYDKIDDFAVSEDTDIAKNNLCAAKIERLLSIIAEYRRRVAYTPIKELLQQLISDTGYEAYVGSLPSGDQRRANLALLLEKAGAFQNTSFLWTVSFYPLS